MSLLLRLNQNSSVSRLTMRVLILCFLTSGIVSCDRPKCTNQNPIFDNNPPNTKVYKDELVEQLKGVDSSELSYWLQKYEELEGQEYLYFYVQGDGLCAILVMTMMNWNQLERVREKKGVGRRGAQFIGLEFDIIQDSYATSFNYKSYERIFD